MRGSIEDESGVDSGHHFLTWHGLSTISTFSVKLLCHYETAATLGQEVSTVFLTEKEDPARSKIFQNPGQTLHLILLDEKHRLHIQTPPLPKFSNLFMISQGLQDNCEICYLKYWANFDDSISGNGQF
jgi:hypothetical protein